MAYIPDFVKVYTENKELQDIQNSAQVTVNYIKNNPFYKARQITVTLPADTNVTINTGTQIQGWIVAGKTSVSGYIPQEISRSSSQLVLKSSVTINLDIILY